MLGDGRPFMFEITNPRKTFFSQEELHAIEQKVNKSNDIVQIRDLAIISK
jgi:tRNA U54 and U55 pseudouridine synthase Pus10